MARLSSVKLGPTRCQIDPECQAVYNIDIRTTRANKDDDSNTFVAEISPMPGAFRKAIFEHLRDHHADDIVEFDDGREVRVADLLASDWNRLLSDTDGDGQ